MSDSATNPNITWLRGALPYINAHRHKVVVLALSGSAVQHENFQAIVHDIALLNSLGMKIVIVHGARPQIDARLQRMGMQPRYYHHLRVTDPQSLVAVQDATGAVRIELEASLSMGLVNSPMHGSKIRICSGNFVTAKPIGVVDGVDYMHTGQVRRVDTDALHEVLSKDAIVLLSNLGYSPTGEVFNLSFEEVATATALAIGAEKVVFFNSADGLLDEQDQLLREIRAQHCESLELHYLETDRPELANQLRTARHACVHGIDRIHFISYRRDGALLEELLTRDGNGTLLSVQSFERTRKAIIDDVGGILELIAPLEDSGVLVKRSREVLETEIEHFTVIERDGMIIACAAQYPYPEERMSEVACVAVHPDYRDGDRGNLLLSELERQARAANLSELFVLTTRTGHWFIERGFQEAELDSLPEKKQSLYNYQRNSKVLFKAI